LVVFLLAIGKCPAEEKTFTVEITKNGVIELKHIPFSKMVDLEVKKGKIVSLDYTKSKPPISVIPKENVSLNHMYVVKVTTDRKIQWVFLPWTTATHIIKENDKLIGLQYIDWTDIFDTN
jgi:hypothetical protein